MNVTKTKAPKSRRKQALEKRYMIRTTDEDLRRWEDHARTLGFNGAGPWLRKLANDALAAA